MLRFVMVSVALDANTIWLLEYSTRNTRSRVLAPRSYVPLPFAVIPGLDRVSLQQGRDETHQSQHGTHTQATIRSLEPLWC